MALINCPYCGKQVSDKSEKCVHCGEQLYLIPQEPKEKSFETLSASEQEAIYTEFIIAHPEHDYGAAGLRQLRNAMVYAIIVFFLLLGFLFISVDEFRQYKLAILDAVIWGVMFIIWLIVFSCLSVSYNRYIKKIIISVKVFQRWLKLKKGLNYVPNFNDKQQQKIFDEINIENYRLR